MADSRVMAQPMDMHPIETESPQFPSRYQRPRSLEWNAGRCGYLEISDCELDLFLSFVGLKKIGKFW